MFRFVHSSDLHIGKRFGNLPEDLRGRLREARHEAIGRLAAQASAHGASHVLLAGDTFDTETPSPAALRQALAAMAGHASLRWVILPGNHDSLQADELWSSLHAALPPNVVPATEPVPLALGGEASLLPAPCTTRRPGRDLSAWMDGAATPEGAIRIGLAHGSVQSFTEDGHALDIIAPDRPEKAGLDYLALGDWHGQVRVGPRCWYSGTPEPDRFKHGAPGSALLVAIAGPGAEPEIRSLPVAGFAWRTLVLDLLAGSDVGHALTDQLPAADARRQVMLRIRALGRVSAEGRASLERAVAAAAPEFAHVELDADGLAVDCSIGNLDMIDAAGALRQAAEALLAESREERSPPEARAVATEALVRLFALCGERAS